MLLCVKNVVSNCGKIMLPGKMLIHAGCGVYDSNEWVYIVLLVPQRWGTQADYSTQEALTAHSATGERTMNDIEQ